MKQVQVTKHELLSYISSVGGSTTRADILNYFDIERLLLQKRLERYRKIGLLRTGVFESNDVVLTNFGYKMLEDFDNGYCRMPMCLCHRSD